MGTATLSPLYGDTNETPEIARHLAYIKDFQLRDLNREGWADYMWLGYKGDGSETIQHTHVERKTWFELSNLDAVEDQLRRHQEKKPEARLIFMLEGVITPSARGFQTFKETLSKGRPMFFANREQSRPLSMIYAWLHQIAQFVEVIPTYTVESSANALVALYHSDQKQTHSTMERYMRKVTWHPNKQVQRLLGVAQAAGIGPEKAEALISQFGTVWNVLSVTEPEYLTVVDGIGIHTAKKLLASIGRPDA